LELNGPGVPEMRSGDRGRKAGTPSRGRRQVWSTRRRPRQGLLYLSHSPDPDQRVWIAPPEL